mmetsp:Transcript_4380/g.9895  ORF Transcript_4380/g.9895 Transcript_4380/m.9895 type:complete len:552 (-) Transcript_4380:72-1727(-)
MALLVRFCKTLDQRFPASQECAFKQSLEPSFVVPMYTAAVASIAATLWSQWSLGGRVTDSVSLIIASKNICTVLLMLSLILALVLRRWIARRLGFIDLEYVSAVLVPIGLTIWSLGGKWYAAQLVGRDPRQFWGDWSGAGEINLVMKVIISTTFCCVLLPMRTHVSCAVSIFCISMFFVVTLTTSSPYPENVFVLMFYLCCSSGFLMIAGSRQESHLRKEWLAQRQIEKQCDISEKQRQGFSHLLNRLCDCLLQLGPRFEIIEPCPNLAAMLFLTTGRPLQGSRFCDYLASEDDRDRFVAALGSNTSETESSGILPTHLRDAQSREVQVHIYYTSFHDKDGSLYHIIGIVEAGGRTSIGEPVEEPGELCNAQKTHGRHSVLEDHESSDSESELALESVSGVDLEEVAVTLQDDDKFTVSSCTPAFAALCGPIGNGAHLKDCIVNTDDFTRRVQLCVNNFVDNAHLGGLVLRTPSSTKAGLEYVIHECNVEAVSGSRHPEYDQYQQFSLRLRLDHIQQRVYSATSERKKKKKRVAPTSTSMSNMSPRQLCHL